MYDRMTFLYTWNQHNMFINYAPTQKLSLQKDKCLFYPDELLTRHICNVLAGRTAVIWGYPTGFEQDTGSLNWKFSNLHTSITGETSKLPLLRPRPNLGVMGLGHQYVLKALCVFACVTKVESTGLSDMELNNYPTTMLFSSRWVIPVSPLFRETQSIL